jgi:hypothetical protein
MKKVLSRFKGINYLFLLNFILKFKIQNNEQISAEEHLALVTCDI